jgi:hypothetical protein
MTNPKLQYHNKLKKYTYRYFKTNFEHLTDHVWKHIEYPLDKMLNDYIINSTKTEIEVAMKCLKHFQQIDTDIIVHFYYSNTWFYQQLSFHKAYELIANEQDKMSKIIQICLSLIVQYSKFYNIVKDTE